MSASSTGPAGIILAGGLGRRMGGGDKPLVTIGGASMLARVIARLTPQVGPLAINANGDPGRFSAYGLPVIADTVPGFAGPLAGILAGMRWSQANAAKTRFMVSVAADTPFFPPDLATRLAEAGGGSEQTIAIAASAEGVHPVFGLWPVRLADELQSFLESGTSGKILAFVDRFRRVEVRFESIALAGGGAVDPFFNVNTPDDAAAAEEVAAALARTGA